MGQRKKPAIRVMRVKPGESLKSIYARMRRSFTAADLQKYTDLDEPCVPMGQVIAELEAIQREEAPRRKKKKKA